jgi:mono/diheme cytochrome c family protein
VRRCELLLIGCLLCWAGLAQAGDVQKGKMVFNLHCSFCHGSSGRGDGPAGAALKPPPSNFTSKAFWKSTTVETMRNVIKNGKPGTAMVPFNTSLSPEDTDNVLAYLQTFKPK